jgi:hypothetical protein
MLSARHQRHFSGTIAMRLRSHLPGRRHAGGAHRAERNRIVPQRLAATDTLPRGSHARPRSPRLVIATALALGMAVAGIAAGTAAAGHSGAPKPPVRVAVVTRDPAAAVTVLPGTPAATAAGLASQLFARAPAVVVTSPAGSDSDAAVIASRAHAPLLLAPAAGSAADRAALLAAVRALRPKAVLAAGLPVRALATELPGIRVVASARSLPATRPPALMRKVALLVGQANSPGLDLAVGTTANVAGADVIGITGDDPRADPAAIGALTSGRPQYVIGVGTGFTSQPLLAARVAVAETGVQLPGGGQILFPGREIVALYGTPLYPSLGALGQQSLQASIARAEAVAAQYNAVSRTPVVPAFEIIATVATAGPGPSGLYSHVITPAELQPWVQAAARAGLYVTLDLQPGRANLLSQAKIYQSLLEMPNVGLALDPEWKLLPGQLPLHQIGSVSIAEVNSVASWLAALTASYHLPQKLLELHEFQLSMIQNIRQLDTGYDNLAIVINMDGQGPPNTKRTTWRSVVTGAPPGVFFGWKDFYAKDTPMLGPLMTIGHVPTPVLISYQ